MSKMLRAFKDTVAGTKDFIYMDSTDSWLLKIRGDSKWKTDQQDKMNELWFYWKESWKGGSEDVVVPSQEEIEGILGITYTAEDYNSGEGKVETTYRIVDFFSGYDSGRFAVFMIFEAFRKIKGGV